MKSTAHWLLALLAVFSLVVAACGSDSDDSAAEEATEAPTEDSGSSGDEVDSTTYGTERPEGVVAGAVFDAMDFLTYDDQTAVCTAEVTLQGTTEEELLAAGISVIEETVVAAALACGADEEAMESLRLTLQRSPLNEDEG